MFKTVNRRFKHLVLEHEKARFVKEHSDSKHKYSEDNNINTLELLVDKMFMVFAGKIFQQTVGIPMRNIYMLIRSGIHVVSALGGKEAVNILVLFYLQIQRWCIVHK